MYKNCYHNLDFTQSLYILFYWRIDFFFQFKQLHDRMFEELSMDGEPVYGLCHCLYYLYISRYILLECRQYLQNLQTADWWLLRCLSIQQNILDDKSPTLKETIMELIDKLSVKEPLMTDDKNRDLIIQFNLEAGYLCFVYYEYKKANYHFNAAKKMSGLTLELSGAMGKRTRFQEENKAQLVLMVSRETTPTTETTTELSSIEENKKNLPKNVSLDDDTLYNEILFQDGDKQFATNLSSTEQALVLGTMENYRRSRAHHDTITEEEIMAYITCVLSQVKCWSVSVAALFLRCCLEKSSRRKVERSMMQLEELVNQVKRSEPSAGHRLYLFYATKIPPVWMIQRQLADLLISLGAVGSALEIYERLELWEDAIKCYQRLGKLEKAETVIREQLAIKETANLWCFLGDVTNNITCYEKAWELSNHRSARAQRCLGYVYLGKEDYEKCMECFEKSLIANGLQVPVWFTYGCAAMAAEKFDVAVKAFKRCTSIDTDNYEAWNNLASAYCRLKEKKKAFLTLKEAVKCNYENWRIWDNLLVVGTDCGEFREVIQAYHRLMDLKEKWVDVEVLKILVRAVCEDMTDAKGQPASLLKEKLLELFGRITSKTTSDADVWRLYAQLTDIDSGDKPEKQEKVLQYLQKSHRCVMQDPKWEQDTSRCKEVSSHSVELADTYLTCSEKSTTSTKSIQMLSSAKLMIKGVLTKIKQQHTDSLTGALKEEVQESCQLLEDKMNQIVEKINELKSS